MTGNQHIGIERHMGPMLLNGPYREDNSALPIFRQRLVGDPVEVLYLDTCHLISPRTLSSKGGAELPLCSEKSLDDIVLRAIRETSDILGPVLVDHQDIVLTVAASPREPFRHHDHRLHGDHHIGLEHRLDILAQLQARLAAIVVAQGTEGVAIAEGAILEQIMLGEDLVELVGDVTAAHAGLDQLLTAAVDLAVDLPQAQVLVGGMAEEQGALQRGVVARDHRKSIQAENVTGLYTAASHRVVSTVGVNTG